MLQSYHWMQSGSCWNWFLFIRITQPTTQKELNSSSVRCRNFCESWVNLYSKYHVHQAWLHSSLQCNAIRNIHINYNTLTNFLYQVISRLSTARVTVCILWPITVRVSIHWPIRGQTTPCSLCQISQRWPREVSGGQDQCQWRPCRDSRRSFRGCHRYRFYSTTADSILWILISIIRINSHLMF